MCGWKTDSAGIRRTLTVAVALTVAGFFVLAGCTRREQSEDASTLRVSQRNEPATLDPQLATLPDEFFVIRALSEGLVTPNPTGGEPFPATASRWETSNDGITWTFHLRPDARWSNGETVTAQHVVDSIRRMLTPTTAAPKAALFFALKNAARYLRGEITDFGQVGAAAPNPQTLVLTLERATPDFLALIASGPWIPVHTPTIAEKGKRWTQPGSFIGNGRFTLREWAPNQRLVVQRNPQHWAAKDTRIEQIDFLVFDSGDTEERAFRAGQVDVTMSVPVAKLDSYRHANPPVLQTVPLHETRYLALNVTRPPLNDVRVRQALSLALDRALLVDKVLKGGQQPAFTYIPRNLGGFASSTRLAEDVAQAQRLLAEAGFPAGHGFPKLELSTWGASTAVLEAIQQTWRERLGIEIGLIQREGRVHFAALASGDYDLGFWVAIPDYNSARDLLDDYLTGAPGNYPRWSDAAFDRLIASDPTAAEARWLEQLPAIPLYFNTKKFLLRPNIRGWQEDAIWTRYYDHVSLEK